MRLARLAQSFPFSKNAGPKGSDQPPAKHRVSSSSNGNGNGNENGNGNGHTGTAAVGGICNVNGLAASGGGGGGGAAGGGAGDLEQQLSAADIAAASLASGLVARRAEPETLSDASVSPTALVQQLGSATSTAPSLIQPVTVSTATTAVAVSSNLLTSVTTPSSLYSNTNPNPNPSQNQNPNPNPNQSQGQSQSQTQRCSCQPQTSPLPHIKEEEESEQANSKQLSLSSQCSETLPPIPTIAGAGYCGSCESVHHSSATSSSTGPATAAGGSGSVSAGQATEYGTASTPSPRIKLKFRKPHKSCWSRIVLAPIGSTGGSSSSATTVIGSNSNETLASSGGSTGNATNTQNSSSVSVAAHHRLTSTSASALASSHPSNSQLLPTSKMQAEQGSIGDLQKYHSRYLKNRRHTLANVRTCARMWMPGVLVCVLHEAGHLLRTRNRGFCSDVHRGEHWVAPEPWSAIDQRHLPPLVECFLMAWSRSFALIVLSEVVYNAAPTDRSDGSGANLRGSAYKALANNYNNTCALNALQ
ncbi:GL19956 [Drosophila persimilis]|uniref:GL19956 n=1 Tax=Drosophila persimilis TaxID=7234 RepID=B4GYN2_DROPE|nr:GL19956 [Drosophila persimilis]